MMNIIEEVIDGDYVVTRYSSGAEVRRLNAPAPAPAPVISVTAAQAITAIANAGMLDALQAWVETLTPLERMQFERVQTFELTSPLLNAGVAALGISEAEKLALFEAARQVVI